ncbi:putative Ig domain-containing protein [Pararhizobium sp. BT-229]|uniref:putative Ig domain-containing protein n=1 Tax=Pararhizobium sp. BT-229 TaxID=2986923 RepID=UPI0021F6F1AF|nr:putative Ig domain-containing protein [Pararhizobium sp. BT-229]MCV9964074.1 putative Ig domain-containing protein [Pararhizobium sp. BT-229]
MLKSIQSSILAIAVAVNGVFPAQAMTYDGGTYFFRHKASFDVTAPAEAKDVSATFVGGVGYSFSQALPLKSSWSDDDWSISSGTLPDGISFNRSTKTFSGTPTAPTKGMKVELRGVDAFSREVATAEVFFDIYTMQGVPFFEDIYAHTGKYKFDQMPLPDGVTINGWNVISGPPQGVQIIGRNLDGTPQTAGSYSMFIQGLDYRDEVVASYAINYLVEDGPTFPPVPSAVYPLPKYGERVFPAFGPPAINHAIGEHAKVKYFLEVAPGETLPGTLASNFQPRNLRVSGSVYEPYQTAKIRWTARDSDDTTGESNWFEIGTSDPSPECNPPGSAAVLDWPTGKAVNTWVGVPSGAVGTLAYEVTSGTLPAPIVLDRNTGYFTGTPLTKVAASPITVAISMTTDGNTVTTECYYSISTSFGQAKIVADTPAQAQHIRLGDEFNGFAKLEGGIPSFDWVLSDTANYPGFAFTTPTADSARVGISGVPSVAGVQSIPLHVSNGDDNIVRGGVPVAVYGELAYLTEPSTFKIKKYDDAKPWGSIAYDPNTVIPDTSGATVQPGISITAAQGQELPEGINFNLEVPYGFFGMTTSDKGIRGPFTVTISDFSGDTKESSPFYIEVLERDDMTLDTSAPAVFSVAAPTPVAIKPVTVKQPKGAETLSINYVLNGPVLPEGLSFQGDAGTITAAADVAYESIGNYGPYTVTATDSEGFSFTSADFYVRVIDKPPINYLPYAQVSGNVTGDVPAGEVQTWIETDSLRARIDANTIFGTKDEVVFTSVTPARPAGLDFDYATGVLSGIPTEEFDGVVEVAFKDIKNRSAVASIPLVIKPYPAIRMTEASYDIPRLADATKYVPVPQKLGGFWNLKAPVWSLALADGSLPLPLNLFVNENTGAIEGRTEVNADTSYPGIIIKAVEIDPNGRKLTTFTPPITINVKPRVAATFDYQIVGDDKLTFKLNDKTQTSSYTLNSGPTVNYHANVVGSYVAPLRYSIPSMPPGLSGIGVDDNGNITGFPGSLGEWTVVVQVLDSDTPKMRKTAPITVKSTLEGFIIPTNANSQVNPPIKLRKGQEFQIPADPAGIKVTNVVGSPVFSTYPPILPAGIDFSGATGSFSAASKFDELPAANGTGFDMLVSATDDDNRSFETALRYRFNVFDRVQLDMTPVSFASKQFVGAIDIQFPEISNKIGDKVSYALTGELPGTRVDSVYDPQSGAFKYFAYTNKAGTAVATTDAKTLPYDAIVFDEVKRTLKGVPSLDGQFPLTITATDSNINAPLYVSSTRTTNERASVDFDIAVEPADELEVSAGQTTYTATKYAAADKVSVTWDEAKNVIGSVSYSLIGDVPGTLVVKSYDPNGAFLGYTYQGGSGSVTTSDITLLPLDAIVFDGKARTLSGIPSQAGSFTFRIKATDSFQWAGGTDETDDITVTVGAEAEMVATNTVSEAVASSETVPQYTAQPGIRTTVANAAYGRKLTWEQVSGTLPSNVSAAKSDFSVGYAGYPDTVGTSDNIVWKATDAIGRVIYTDAVSITVGQRQQLALSSSSNPVGLVVNTTDANAVVTASNRAFGLPIGTGNWTVSGTLPPGITYDITDGAVTFKGKATGIGLYDNIVVSATDSIGGPRGTASITLSFVVLVPDDKITLLTTDVTTKPGLTFSMTPVYGNTYGKVEFSSPEIAASYAGSMTLDKTTGRVSGSFSTSGDRNVNLRVSDETKRLTSNYVTVKVIPVLKPVVATQVKVAQGKALNEEVDAFNILGTVKFEKGGGNWPDGVKVDPIDGKLTFEAFDPITGLSIGNKVTLAAGTYPGLTIRGIDELSDGQSDTQPSNTFSIVVEPIDDEPDIHDLAAGTKLLYTVETPMSYKPTVTEKVAGGVWNYAGTKYVLNKNLKTDTGLDFDEDTGIISGTPTKPVIYTDLTIRVTSARGDTDVTGPIWFGVQPKGPIVASANQKSVYDAREQKAFQSDAIGFDNTYGTLTYSRKAGNTGFAVSASDGAITGTPGAGTSSVTPYPVTVEVKDAFDRTATFLVEVTVLKPIGIAAGGAAGPKGTTLVSSVPTVTNLYGNASYTFSNLVGAKSTWSGASSTGVVSGSFSDGDAGDTHIVTVTVTDSRDGATASVGVPLSIAASGAARYWRFVCTAVDTAFNASEMKLYNAADVNVTSKATVTSKNNYPGYPVALLVDGVEGGNNFYSPADSLPDSQWVKFDFKTEPQDIRKVWFMKRMSYAYHNCTGWNVQSSQDDAEYKTVWAGTFTGWNLSTATSYTSVKP